MSLYDPF